MNQIRTRVRVGPDHRITGRVPADVPPGEYIAEIAIQPIRNMALAPDGADVLARIRALQDEVAGLPILDPRAPDNILGYGADGLFK
jgi:hypothetical protein